MRPQTLISLSIALLLGLTTVVYTGTEAAPVKMQAAPMKSATVQSARINIVRAVLTPGTARTKGKATLKIILHNPTAVKATAFGVQATYRRRVVGKINLRGLNPRARVGRTLPLRLPQQKGRQCVTVKLTKPRGSKLKLGTARKACLTSSLVIRGIGTTPSRKGGTSPTRKVGTRGKLGKTSRIGVKSKVGIKPTKGKTRIGVKFITINNTLNINGQSVSIIINPGQTVTANWAFPTGLTDNPNQVAIRVRQGDFPNIPNECQTGGGDIINSGAINGLTGNYTINLASLTVGQTYKVKACLLNSGTGNTGDESNVVTLQVVPPPDLVVSSLVAWDHRSPGDSVYRKIVQFKTKNIGAGVFTGYAMGILKLVDNNLERGGYEVATDRIFTIQPNGETPQIGRSIKQRAYRVRVGSPEFVSNLTYRLCVTGRASAPGYPVIPETNANNNCKDIVVPVSLPDLAFERAWIKLYRVGFGLKPFIKVRIKNLGQGPVFGNFIIRVLVYSQRVGGQVIYQIRPAVSNRVLNPGETRVYKVQIPLNRVNPLYRYAVGLWDDRIPEIGMGKRNNWVEFYHSAP